MSKISTRRVLLRGTLMTLGALIAAISYLVTPAESQDQRRQIIDDWLLGKVDSLAIGYSLDYEEQKRVGRYSIVALGDGSSLGVLDTREGLLMIQRVESPQLDDRRILDLSAEFSHRMESEIVERILEDAPENSEALKAWLSQGRAMHYARRLARTW